MTRRHPQALALLDLIDALRERLEQVTAERDRARDIAARLADEVIDTETWTVDVVDRHGFHAGNAPVRTHHRDDCQGRPCAPCTTRPRTAWPGGRRCCALTVASPNGPAPTVSDTPTPTTPPPAASTAATAAARRPREP